MTELDQWFKVFAQTESEQESYFPKLEYSVVVVVGTFEVTTDSTRMIALCLLCEACKRATARTDAVGQLRAEILSLDTLLLEVGGIYPWLFYHPSQIRIEDGAVDPTIYGNWAVLRRLCELANQGSKGSGPPPPFLDLVRTYVKPVL